MPCDCMAGLQKRSITQRHLGQSLCILILELGQTNNNRASHGLRVLCQSLDWRRRLHVLWTMDPDCWLHWDKRLLHITPRLHNKCHLKIDRRVARIFLQICLASSQQTMVPNPFQRGRWSKHWRPPSNDSLQGVAMHHIWPAQYWQAIKNKVQNQINNRK